MTAHSYKDEISEQALRRARQRVQARPIHPDWCDITTEHRHVLREEGITPWRLLGLCAFGVVMWVGIAWTVLAVAA